MWVSLLLLVAALLPATTIAELTPPYFNLAEGRKIHASATCGVDTDGPELYCKLVGANTENEQDTAKYEVIQGQVCDYCDPKDPQKSHPAEYAIDGTENWWQSPPLSRGMKYNEVNLTIDFGQEFHVAYLFIRMGNSPRPGLWTLEKSNDYGKTWTAWQHFSDSPADCETYFGKDSLRPITADDNVICTTEYSKIVPLENGEIPVTLLTGRPSANDYFNSPTLQEWTRATNVRIRLLRTKNLLGHLMSVARQDPTVTRRYFYSIKDISIGGRCVCNGHASTCGLLDAKDPARTLACFCQHHTCGTQCDKCCPGFEQKKWRQNTKSQPFVCEPCNCHGHSSLCEYDEDVDNKGLSLDIHGNYEGGGVCQDCQHNTEGINCNKCKPTFYRPYGKYWNETDVCQPCNCNFHYSTGNCEEETGRCECRKEFESPNCDRCSYGHFGYPDCRPCECNLEGTDKYQCEAVDGKCPCKPNFAGDHCDQCAAGYYNFTACEACECNPIGSTDYECEQESGQCTCRSNYAGKQCDVCKDGYYNYPDCTYCNCDLQGTVESICDKDNGKCICRPGYGGARCDKCLPGYFGYPDCVPCNCSTAGSVSTVCDHTGRCPCLSNFGGKQCTSCQAGYYQYPECITCNCDPHGSIGISCNNEGQCQCANNFDGKQCNSCKEGFYNYPACEECNCDPAGVIAKFAGCGSVPAGELCQCKERVQGRICNECRPLYWNLNATNFHGCEECDCFIEGTIGALDTCDTKTGQCTCKPSITSRNCGECKDGSFDLFGGSLFGCKDCGCDIGGSAHGVCQKVTGQCKCHPRVSGRTCNHPLTTHYYPTLYQFQFEYEDGYTSSGSQVRYQYNENLFPEFSKKGYAVFSQLQNEVINEVNIYKSSVYRLVIRYNNPTEENIVGSILITSDNPLEDEQRAKVVFKPTTTPQFVTVSGTKGDIPSPVVLDPGRYQISMKSDTPNLLLDYFVLLPAAYYEASILTRNIETPCEVGGTSLCRHYQYPSVKQFNPTYTPFITEGNEAFKPQDFYKDYEHLAAINEDQIPLLSSIQPQLNYMMDVKNHGKYVLVVDYITDKNLTDAAILTVNLRDEPEQDGAITVYPCLYTMVCRQPIVDKEAREKVFYLDVGEIRPIEINRASDIDIAIKSITAIPYEEWSTDYITPSPVCIYEDGVCVQSNFQSAPEARKVDFVPEDVGSDANETRLMHLDHEMKTISIMSTVPEPSRYVVILHYNQPHHPNFNLHYTLTTDRQNYDGKIHLKHCPSYAGCRQLVTQDNDLIWFEIDDAFTFNLTNTYNNKDVFLNNLILVPADVYKETLLREGTYDQTKEFIHKCGQDHFYIPLNASDFCKNAVFSLTTAYNDGALPCNCDYIGSTSFECEPFGGQCQCKPNVIGRQCDACRTGFYGFPDCKPCDCPVTALCEKETGACICPTRVRGEKCNECEAFTYGFDPIIGCEECDCHPQGVLGGNLQCDLNNGSCPCRENIVGRKCDLCDYGYHSFPACHMCDCNRDGTTFEICDQTDERCFCKKNVEGRSCERCKEGTYNLQKNNPEGCTKCFCFGKTTRCEQAYLKPFNVSMLNNVTVNKISMDGGKFEVHQWEEDVDRQLNETLVKVDFNVVSDDLRNGNTYVGCVDYLLAQNNHLSSYGGYLTYKVFFANGPFGSAIIAPDVILKSNKTFIVHTNYEQPAPRTLFTGAVHFVETNFLTSNGLPVTREQFMTILRDLDAIYIRASYWQDGLETTVSDVYLTLADEDPDSYHEYQALSVERCECPPGYQGLSCEDCAPGFYRDPNGPYGGYCIPCDCHGHADTCDCNTGICQNCKHNTMGDHCDMCIAGYYGNATRGYPDDCMICACPLPVESNNFATSCEVSEDGYRVHCQCKEGYTGEMCQSCAPGYYGEPQIEGEYCKPCQCNGNIDPSLPGSCDSVSGECLLCMNNTAGAACNLCAPGYYGDAVTAKDCKSCICEEMGTQHCDNTNGKCECLPNVIGDRCDRCDYDHYGFDSGYGCTSCDCGEASNSTQCNDHTGQCPCKPGVTGKYCDRCLPGYWNYSKDGCEHCKCNTEFSRGLGCDARTGQCQCLPGVVGEKCDRCPHRWVLIPDAGCFVCDECHHALLDVTDQLRIDIDSVKAEFEEASQPYFTARKLAYYEDAIKNLIPEVSRLDPNGVNLMPYVNEINKLVSEAKVLEKKANYSVDYVTDAIKDGNKAQDKANNALDDCRLVNKNAKNAARDVQRLADSFYSAENPKLDLALSEAQSLLDLIKKEDQSVDGAEQKERSETVLDEVNEYAKPVQEQADRLKQLKDDIGKFDERLEDLFVRAGESRQKADDAEFLNGKNKRSPLSAKFDTISNSTKQMDKSVADGKNLINDADRELENVHKAHNEMENTNLELKDTNNGAENVLEKQDVSYSDLNDLLRNAQIRADELQNNAELLDREYSDGTSNAALKAARSYDDIVDTADLARKLAETALAAATNATDLTDGIGARAGSSDQVARDLLSGARDSLKKVQVDLQPHLDDSANSVQSIKDLNKKSDDMLLAINAALDGIPPESHAKIWDDAIVMAEDAEDSANDDLKAIKPIVKELPESLTVARQIPKDIDETSKSIGQINTHLDRVNSQLPEILKLDEDVGKAQDRLASKLSHITEQIEAIKQNVKLAREKANDINVGLQFYPNTTLELKAPENLAVLSNTQASAYFKTDRPNGFLFYLGNEAKHGGRPGKNEDFMELELENGYPVLNIDLGNGPEKVIGKKYVADDKWYQVIVDRTGNNVKLQIRDQDEDGEEIFTETPYELPGDQNLFNWDDNSRIFVGGYPPDYKMQDTVKYNYFAGQIEDFRVNNEPVGLWNFVDGQSNTDGALERDRLLTSEVPSNGLRFGGNGFVALDAKPYRFSDKSSISFKFKAARDSPDGLLFYAGSDRHLIAVELEDGDVVFQFKLGEKAENVKIRASQKLNDDQWHQVVAERDGRVGVLTVDDNRMFQSDDVYTTQGGSYLDGYLEPTDVMYFGGYPGKIPHPEVKSKSFDGCIQDVQLAGTAVDLNRNLRALDVRPGCPVKTSSILSYNPGEVGYLKNENLTANNNFVINLKFRTREDRGLIFFVTNPDQSATFSLAIEDGILVLRSNNEELNTGKNRYDNGEWHVATATHQSNRLRLSIDDVFQVESEDPPAPLYLQNGDIYFGGLPKGFRAKSGTVSTDAYFLGCISDVTINSQLVNFAQSVDRQNAVLDQCPRDLFDYDPLAVPTYYPDGRVEHKLSPEEYEKTKNNPDHAAGHIDSRFGEDDDDFNKVDPSGEDDKLPIKPVYEPTTPKTTTTTTTRRPRPTKRPLPKDAVCALSPTPDLDVDFDAGWRFGTGQYSRVEFDVQQRSKKQYSITLEFKSGNPDGLLFYASDQRHTDFIAVYLRNGHIHHTFNCGSGKSNMTSELQYNDNEWHTVKFTRSGNKGKLIVDDTDSTEGESLGTARTMQLVSPYYVGGFTAEALEDVAVNLALEKDHLEKNPFFGCIRNIKLGGDPIGEPSSMNNVQPCSDNIESGVFFENGYVKLREKFRVGTETKISFDIKPRSQNGFLMSVHGKKAFFIIELVNGTIHFSVDNGEGPIVAKFEPEEGENYCDGEWRTIIATKSLFLTTIAVNNVVSEPAIGNSDSTSTDTTRPLFLGGHPHIKKLRGLTVRTPFQGCIRNVKIRDVPEPITPKMIVGNVQAGVCPLT